MWLTNLNQTDTDSLSPCKLDALKTIIKEKTGKEAIQSGILLESGSKRPNSVLKNMAQNISIKLDRYKTYFSSHQGYAEMMAVRHMDDVSQIMTTWYIGIVDDLVDNNGLDITEYQKFSKGSDSVCDIIGPFLELF